MDWCEDPAHEKEVFDVNVRGTANVCGKAEKLGIPVVLLSTDHVFKGGRRKFKENGKLDPLNFYGFSKMGAESLQRLFPFMKIIRTSYFFDKDRLLGMGAGDYPTFIIRPFLHIHHLSLLLLQYFDRIASMPDVLHLAGSESISWYGFMKQVNEKLNMGEILPRSKEDANYMAPRPKKLVLNMSLSKKLGFPEFSYKDGVDIL